MKIYLIGTFENPTEKRVSKIKTHSFAHFAAVGTWVTEREVCDSCDWQWQRLGAPLMVQWEASTDRVGDFSWDGPFGYVFVVKASVAEKLASLGIECTFLPVDFVNPERKRNTIAFPYVGPNLVWGECSASVNLDEHASKVKMESSCESRPHPGASFSSIKRAGLPARSFDGSAQQPAQVDAAR